MLKLAREVLSGLITGLIENMAVEIFSENPSRVMSPRISFSYDLCQSDIVPVEQPFRSSASGSGSVDFNFCVDQQSFEQESSSADELFSDGKLLPSEIKKNTATNTRPKQAPSEEEVLNEDHKSPSEVISNGNKQKSFWRFKRSSSFNCGSGYGPSLCPIPLLSRSSSTGAATSNGSKSISIKTPNSQPSFSRPPLKKNLGIGSSHGNRVNVRVDPVINVHSANLFGLGSFLSSTRNKNKKK